MINTGLLLRRPFESDYSAYRRFLIANHTQSGPAIRAGLAAKLLTVPGKRYALPALAQRWERAYCEHYQIPYQTPVNNESRLNLRNCPSCARFGYHSYLFQFPWFRQCPIHQEPVVPVCPRCQRRWPLASELHNTRSECPTCGIHFDLGRLVSAAARAPKSGFEVLEELDRAVQQHHGRQLELIGDLWRSQHSDWRLENSPDSPNWISLVYPRTDTWERTCAAIDARLEPVSVSHYLIGSPVSGPSPSPDDYPHARKAILQERALTKRVLRGLTKPIRAFVPPHRRSTSCSSYEYGDVRPLSEREVFRISFNAWRTLYSADSRQHPLPFARYFCRPEYVDLPSSPIMLTHLTVAKQPCPIPQTLTRDLLRAELWRCYLGMVGHLVTLSNALYLGHTWRDYYRLLPDDALPNNIANVGLNLASNHLTIVLPERLAKATGANLSKALETPCSLRDHSLIDDAMNQRWTSPDCLVSATLIKDRTREVYAAFKKRIAVNGQVNLFERGLG